MHNVNQVTYYIEIYFKGFLWTLKIMKARRQI